MQKVNRILILFLAMTALLLWWGWGIMQTEWFANIIEKKVTKNITSKLGVNLEFERLDFKLYPPASIIKKVKLSQTNKRAGGIQSLEASQIGIYFNIWDFLSNKITVEKIRVYDAEVIINSIEEMSVEKEIKKNNFEEIISSLLDYESIKGWIKDNLPVKIEEIFLEKTFLIIEDQDFEINELSLLLKKDEIKIQGLFENMNIESEFIKKGSSIKGISCSIDLLINSEEVVLKSVEIKNKLISSWAGGVIRKKGNDVLLDIDAKVKGLVSNIFEMIKIEDISAQKRGLLDFKFQIGGHFKKPNISFKMNSENVILDWITFDSLKIGGKINKSIVTIESIDGKKSGGMVSLLKPVPLFNLSDKKILSRKIEVDVDNLHTNHAFFAIDDILSTLKGRVTGNVAISWIGNSLFFHPQKEVVFKNFSLKTQDGNENILQNKGFSIIQGSFELRDFKDVLFDTTVKLGEFTIPVKGEVDPRGLKIITEESIINFEDLGPISGTPLHGEGKFKIRVAGPFENVKFFFDVDLKNFKVIDLSLGDVKGNVVFDLSNLKLDIIGAEGSYFGNKYGGGGSLTFSEKGSIDLNLRIFEGEYEKTLEMIKPVLTGFKNSLPSLSMSFSSEFEISGELDADKLLVKGELEARDIKYKTEDIHKLSLNYEISSSEISLDEIRIKKNKASLDGKMKYNIKKKELDFSGHLSSLGLNDLRFYKALNMGLQGKVSGEFYGAGPVSSFSSRLQLKLRDSSVKNKKVGDSHLTFYNNGLDVFASGSFLNDTLKFESMINLGKKRSKIQAALKTNLVRELFGVVSSHNIDNEDLVGSVDAFLTADFYIHDYKDLNLYTTVNELSISNGETSLEIVKDKDKLIIKNGKIVKFDLQGDGNGNGFSFTGSGDLNQKFKIEQGMSLDASFLELFSKKIKKASGKLKARAFVMNKKEESQTFFQISGNNIAFHFENIPGIFTDTSFRIVLDGDDLLIQDFKSYYGKGKVSISGGVHVVAPIPKIDIEFEVNNSSIPIFEKSHIVLSGKGRLEGDSLPYLLHGDLSIYHGEILDGISDFKQQSNNSKQYNKYIPRLRKKNKYKYFNFDIAIGLARPVKIKNSFGELYFTGGAKVIGKDDDLSLEGEFDIIPNTSRFTFKGHAFNLTEGKVSFIKDEKKINPNIKFVGVSDINSYSVKVDVGGPSDNVKVNLSSDPLLSQEDILSLLTIGVTTDVSRNLDETERQSVTTIGVGSLLVDQLKLNEGLTSSMGLQLSVLPEISEDETSFLRGKSGVTDSQATKLKSTTKIKVKKRVSKNIEISVSSTVGGTLEQRQEMNINYNINKKFSIEGVYEVNSSDENSIEMPNSVGADLKYKWKF